MSDHPQLQTLPGTDRQSQTLVTEEERDRYQLLLDINNAVVTRLGLGSLLPAISDSLRKVIPHDSAAITLYDPETSQLRLHSFDLQYASDREEGALFPLEGTPEGLAFTSRRPVVIRKLDLKSSRPRRSNTHINDGLRSGCSIPLVAHDRALGTLDVASRSENAFTDENAELLNHIAGQREEIVRALRESKGRVGGDDGAAARLGLNRTTLLSRIKKFGIHPKQFS